MSRTLLALEFLALFVALPPAYCFSPVRLPPLPVLWAVAGYALWQLLRDPHFDRSRLWNARPLTSHLGLILGIFAVTALAIWLGVHRFAPQLEWSFVRRNPAIWAIVMVAYPVLSVYPKGYFTGRFSLIATQHCFLASGP